MWQRAKTACFLALLGLVGIVAAADAESPSRVRLYVSSVSSDQALPLLSFAAPAAAGGSVDYAMFATELLAYLTKEVLSDSRDEYTSSPLGSRWSSSMPDGRSEF